MSKRELRKIAREIKEIRSSLRNMYAKDFELIVEEKDKEYAESGITADAEDLLEELVLEHGKKYRSQIKEAVEDFYQITLK